MRPREFISLIIIDLLLLVTALVNALLPLPIETSVSLPIVVFIIGAIILYREAKHKEELSHKEENGKKELRFIKRLENFVKDFDDKIVNIAYVYSITSIANRIANDKIIRQQRIAWQLFLSHLNEDLTKHGILLHNRVKQRKGEFTNFFQEFSSLLSLLRKFKNQFYKMVTDTKKIHGFSNDSEFKKTYEKFSEEFNKYMDKLEFFSDEVKAEFGLSLGKGLTEHVKDFSELYPPAVKL